MRYWLTVVWIFILWTNKGLTESKPTQPDTIESRSIDTGSWNPLPLTSGRIIPTSQPSIYQHNSRVRVENQNEPPSNRQARSNEETQHETTLPPRQNKAANPEIRDSIKVVTNQLLDPNNITLDTRTPPKLQKLHLNKHHSSERIKGDMTVVENSHPGIAIPVTEEDLSKVIEDHTKKVVIHRNHNKVTPTTDSGLSTWILLSGGQTTTSKTVSKPETTTKHNKTANMEKTRVNNKIRTTTRPKPTSTTSTTTTEISQITEVNILQNNKTKHSNKVKVPSYAKEKPTPTTTQKSTTTTTIKTVKPSKRNNTNIAERIDSASSASDTNNATFSTKLQQNSQTVETKEGELDLTTESSKKSSKKPPRQSGTSTVAPKRKKNKNRRRRPGNNKNVNGTKIANKPQQKEKPISTQVYNYLSREILPTVGVGLVGLVVTAGLASYFLYPFTGAVRRAYEIADRKDDKYYYNDDYNYGGLSEEDVISKVIAGMPASSAGLQDYAYAKPTTTLDNRYRNSDSGIGHNPYKDLQNVRYRHSTNTQQYPSYSASYSQDKVTYNQISKYGGAANSDNTFNYKTEYPTSPTYRPDIIAEHQKESGYTVSAVGGNEMTAQKFVVGNIPKEVMVTPAAVPEHGPRQLKQTRRRRNANNNPKHSKSIENNEILDDIPEKTSVVYPVPNGDLQSLENEKNERNKTSKPIKQNGDKNPSNETKQEITTQKEPNFSFITFLKNLFEFKMRLGLAIMHHTSEAISRYVHDVQARMEQSLRRMQIEEERNRLKQQLYLMNSQQNSSQNISKNVFPNDN